MMDKHIFISTDKFKFSRWDSAFPKVTVYNDLSSPTNIEQGCVVWVLSQTQHWIDFVEFYSKAGFKVIVLTRNEDIDEFKTALQAGARGYAEALSTTKNLQQIARSVNEGAMWLPSALLARMIGHLSHLIKEKAEPADLLDLLTARERSVTDLVLTGATNKEIAADLNITERTVKAHLTSIFNKLGARDRMHLVLIVKGY